jgi:hypothetical protein
MWICQQCGKTDVQEKAWVDMNTGKKVDDSLNENGDEYWCDTCEEKVEVSQVDLT